MCGVLDNQNGALEFIDLLISINGMCTFEDNTTFYPMKKTILIFGSLAAILFLLFELNKLSLWGTGNGPEVLMVLSGLLFIGIGFLLSRFLSGKKEIRKVRGLKKSNLTKQEHRVLLLMMNGRSNNEIAQQLFISENTVKTHVSHILAKLKAKRRTEAVKIGRDLNII